MNAQRIHLNIPGSEMFRTVKIPSLGGGHCFFHTLSAAFYVAYRTGNLNGEQIDKTTLVVRLRTEIARALGERNPRDPHGRTYYQSLSNGELPGFAKADPRFELSRMQAELRSNSDVGEGIIDVTSQILSKAIYYIDAKTMDVYQRGGMPDPQLPSICMLSNGNHFELIGIIDKHGTHVTHFGSQHEFILMLRQRLQSMKKD